MYQSKSPLEVQAQGALAKVYLDSSGGVGGCKLAPETTGKKPEAPAT
jgi:hypothetical protein